jgi:hypothetical protein
MRVDPKDPKTFPEPHRFATHIQHRSTTFRTHGNLGQAKNAISGCIRTNYRNGQRLIPCDAYVYEWSPDTGWVLLHFFPSDSNIDDHEFYKTTAKKGATLGPSDAAIEAAIKSITGS